MKRQIKEENTGLQIYVLDTKEQSVKVNNYTLSALKMTVRGNILQENQNKPMETTHQLAIKQKNKTQKLKRTYSL